MSTLAFAIDPMRRALFQVSTTARPFVVNGSLLCFFLWALGFPGPSLVAAAEFDESKLPAAASVNVEFARDIKPVLEQHCFKCHGEEKPKSGFRLTSRENALKGGSQGVDIVPGQSSKSPLVYYVARLVPDMEMPPEGRGTPLTIQEVGLLRAWIDQGVVWEARTNPPSSRLDITALGGGTAVSGDKGKFRELNWMRDGWYAGAEDFEFRDQLDQETRLTLEGRLLPDDYRLTLDLDRSNFGFAHFGWSQFRKYYDDLGGYSPLLDPSSFSLDRNLHMDHARAWIDLGLTLPGLPRAVLGYEYQLNNGAKSTLQWGLVSNGTSTNNIYPAFRDISERVHILKLDLDYEIAGVLLTDSFRGEWYALESQRENDAYYLLGSGMALTRADEKQTYFQGANTFHVEKRFGDWLLASGGYLYSKLSSDASMDVKTYNPEFLEPSIGAYGWHAEDVELERESHVFSLSALLGPWAGLSATAAVQGDWTRQQGLGAADVELALPAPPPFYFLIDQERFRSDTDRSLFSETFGLRYSGIPHATLFAEARFQQEKLGQYQEDVSGLTPFLLDTDTHSDLADFRAGFNVSPWRRVSWSAYYRRHDKDTHYDYAQRETFGQPYPGFFRWRDILSNEAGTKLSFDLAAWLKTSLSYSWIQSAYHASTEPVDDPILLLPGGLSPGGSLLAGTYEAHTVSLNSTLTLAPRWFFSGTFAFQDARTQTFARSDPSTPEYKGPIYSVLFDGHYLVNDKADLFASYTFSTADFTQNDFTTGPPVGMNYEQHAMRLGASYRLRPTISVGLEYRFYLYNEPSAGGVPDFAAHGVFATFKARLP